MPEPLVGVVRIVSRADEFDANEIAEAENGRFWGLIREKILSMIEGHQKTLEDSGDDRAIARAQGAAQALRRVLTLPKIVRKEALERAKNK
jgi:hypothetical protein